MRGLNARSTHWLCQGKQFRSEPRTATGECFPQVAQTAVDRAQMVQAGGAADDDQVEGGGCGFGHVPFNDRHGRSVFLVRFRPGRAYLLDFCAGLVAGETPLTVEKALRRPPRSTVWMRKYSRGRKGKRLKVQ